MAAHHAPHACPALFRFRPCVGHLAAMCYASYALSQAVLYRATGAAPWARASVQTHTRPSPWFGIRIEPRAAQQAQTMVSEQ